MIKEEIAEMEKKGYDMSSVRDGQTEMVVQEETDKAALTDRRKVAAVPTDLNKLIPYRPTPCSAENSFSRDVTGKAPLFGKEKWWEKYANAPMTHGAVIWASSDLWPPGIGEYPPAVFVFALDSPHIYDMEWPRNTAEEISEMEASNAVPVDCQEFTHILQSDQNGFCFPLGASLAGGAGTQCITFEFDKQAILPENRPSEDRIVSFLLEARPKKQMPIQLTSIPGRYHQA